MTTVDPRLADLDTAGISPGWRRVAELIGVDLYLGLVGVFLAHSPKTAEEHRCNIPTLVRFLRQAGAPWQFSLFPALPGPSVDPRLADLHAAGLPNNWLELARMVGVDRWAQVIGILAGMDDRAAETRRINAPAALALYRVGRDALVRQLRAAGKSVRAIREFVLRVLGEELTQVRIYQVINANH